METALDRIFVSLPQAVALWLVMLLAIAGAAAALALPRRRPAPSAPEVDNSRYADEVTVAAERAAATAERRRAEWAAAQDALDAAFAAFDEAEVAARRAASAAAYPMISKRRRPGENADRQRWLHHEATRLCRERLLSIAQLNDVLAHRGWNPRLHPVIQESVLRGAVREHLRAELTTATERERAAWVTAEKAADALRSLRLEAAEATTRVTRRQPVSDELFWAEPWTTAELPAVA